MQFWVAWCFTLKAGIGIWMLKLLADAYAITADFCPHNFKYGFPTYLHTLKNIWLFFKFPKWNKALKSLDNILTMSLLKLNAGIFHTPSSLITVFGVSVLDFHKDKDTIVIMQLTSTLFFNRHHLFKVEIHGETWTKHRQEERVVQISTLIQLIQD